MCLANCTTDSVVCTSLNSHEEPSPPVKWVLYLGVVCLQGTVPPGGPVFLATSYSQLQYFYVFLLAALCLTREV